MVIWSLEDEFLSNFAHLTDHALEFSMVGDSLLHFFCLSARQTPGNGFSLHLPSPDPSRGWLRHDTSLTQALKPTKLGSKVAVAGFQLPNFLRG